MLKCRLQLLSSFKTSIEDCDNGDILLTINGNKYRIDTGYRCADEAESFIENEIDAILETLMKKEGNEQ
jgi:hypothetical protein